MSPEQAKGESDMDHRVDVYALGVLLYEMVAGEPPFTGSNYFQILWKHGNEVPPRPSSHDHARAIPHVLEEAILRALAKEPGERFESMEAFAEELRNARAAQASPQRRDKGSSRLLLAGAALALLGVGAWWMSAGGTEEASAPTTTAAEVTAAEVTATAIDRPPKALPTPVDEVDVDPPPTLRFDLKPADAVVQIGDVALQGPKSYALRDYDPNLNEGMVEIKVRKRGYRTKTLTLNPRADPNIEVHLKKQRPKSSNILTEY